MSVINIATREKYIYVNWGRSRQHTAATHRKPFGMSGRVINLIHLIRSQVCGASPRSKKCDAGKNVDLLANAEEAIKEAASEYPTCYER
jgi:hypothetical protein